MLYAVVFFSLLQFCSCEFNLTFHYTVFSSNPLYHRIKVGNAPDYINVHVDTNRPYSLFFGPPCFVKDAKCMTGGQDFVYNPANTGGKRVYPDTTYTDQQHDDLTKYSYEMYEDTITIGYDPIPVELGSIIRSKYERNVYYNGFLGLGISTGKHSIIKRLMQSLTYPQITFQEARRYTSKKNKEMNVYGYGSIVMGEYNEEYCGNFTFIKTLNDNVWKFRRDVTIGNGTVLEGQVIALMIGQNSRIRDDIYEEHLKEDVKSRDDFPSFSFDIDDQKYLLKNEDYAWYTGDKYSSHIDRAKPDIHGYDFAFGNDLWQHYCVALRSDENFENLEIGFAQNFGRNSGIRYGGSIIAILLFILLLFKQI